VSSADPLTVERLRARVREAVNARRAGRPPAAAPLAILPGPAAPWAAIRDDVAKADRLAELPAVIPEMVGFPRRLRPLARLLPRAVASLTRFLTRQQSEYNRAVAAALNRLRYGSRAADAELERKVAALYEALARQDERLRAVEERVHGRASGRPGAAA
jgi:hypothetical protein